MEILPGLYAVQGEHESFYDYVYLVGGNYPIIVDSLVKGEAKGRIIPKLSELGWVPQMVVISHGHADHFGGLAEITSAYPSIDVAAHDADIDWIESTENYIDEMYRQYGRDAGFSYDETRLDWVKTLISGEAPINIRLKHGKILSTGLYDLEVVHLPGHSTGLIGLLDEQRRFAIVSDAVLGKGIKDKFGNCPFPPAYVDPTLYSQSLQIIRNWKVQMLLTGHTPILHNLEIEKFIIESQNFVDQCDETILRVLRKYPNGANYYQLVEEVNSVIGPYISKIEGFYCILAHLQELIKKGTVIGKSIAKKPGWILQS